MLSFYDYWSRYLTEDVEPLVPFMKMSREVGWWWPFNGVVIFTDRPVSLMRDDDGRLHHESSMAIEYSDGFGVWAWHGVLVPEWIITKPGDITQEKVLLEKNI